MQLLQRVRSAGQSRRRRRSVRRLRRRAKFTQRDRLAAPASALRRRRVMTPASRHFRRRRRRQDRLLPSAVFEHRARRGREIDSGGFRESRGGLRRQRDPPLIARRCRCRSGAASARSGVAAAAAPS